MPIGTPSGAIVGWLAMRSTCWAVHVKERISGGTPLGADVSRFSNGLLL